MEDIIRKRLSQYPTPLDTEALWADIEPRLPQKRRSLLPFWVWVLGGVVLLGGLFLFLSRQTEEAPQSPSTSPPVVVNVAPSTSAAPAPAPPVRQEEPVGSSPLSADPLSELTTKSPQTTPVIPELTTAAKPRQTLTGARPARPYPVPEISVSYPTSAPAAGSVGTRPATTPLREASVVADWPVKPASSLPVVKQTLITPALLPASEDYNKVKSALGNASLPRVERIVAGTPPENEDRPAPGRRTDAQGLDTPLARRNTTPPAEAPPAVTDEVKAQTRRGRETEAEENHRTKAQATTVAQEKRALRKERTRQDRLQAREVAETAALARREDARGEAELRAETKEIAKERDKLTRELLKIKRDEYVKAGRQAAGEELKVRPKKIRGKQPAYWSVEAGTALSLTNRSVSSTGNNPDGEQAGINREHEKALEGISLQALVGYHRPGGLSLRTGLVYSRINSRVESEFITHGTEPVQAVVAIIENPDGSRRDQVGTVHLATETITTEKYYNSVRSLDIPVLVGYRFGGTKWGLTVEAGPTFNLSSGGSAHLYDGAGNYQSDGPGHFRSKLKGNGFLAYLGGSYRLSEKTMLTANLRHQGFGKGGFEDPSVGYATKYSLIGIQLGYRFRF